MSAVVGHDPPVRWDEPTKAFLVTGFDAATAVLRGPGWSSDLRLSPLAPPELKDFPAGSLIVLDPPEHTRIRRLISPAFSASAIARLRPRIVAIVDAALDGLRETGPRVDIVTGLGYPVSLAVICELLDVGTEGAQVIAEQTPELARGLELGATVEDLTAFAVANLELTLFLTPILAERRNSPGNDFISALLALSDDHNPAGLGLDEVLATCILLLIAGHETTANLIANSTLALLRDPDQIAHLVAEPARAVEELLRLQGPVKRILRTALVDQELVGRQIPAGQAVLVDVQAANRDPRRFPAAERLDLTREPVGHLGFGAGIHFCLGAALARLETIEILPRLFIRHPELALTNRPAKWRESNTLQALHCLPAQIAL
ncbi:MAG: cytochrome P450 [Sporichthyaceae bacterium]